MVTEARGSVNPANLLTVENYAKSNAVTRQTVYNWIKEGRIKTVSFLGKSFVDKSTKR